MSNTSTFHWNAHGVELFGQCWQPSGQARAVLCLIHGHGEHIGRYAHVADYLNGQEIALIGYDHFGHGKSGGKRGHIPSYEAVMETIDHILAEARERFPGVPVFLYGHSMGGNFVLSYGLRHQPAIAGAVVTSPWIELAFRPAAVDLFLARSMRSIYPSFTQSSKLDASAISRLPEEVEKYVNDPLVHDKISPVLFTGCHEAGQYLLAHAHEWQLPLLLMHGSADRLTSFEASRQFADRAGGAVSWKPWEGLYHELHNEPEREAVLQTMATWVLDQTK
ncbi:MAG: alpha/beta hydrolase [Bacteroidetes bacterium]|nr:MAG: alpha/beta hydrolase [Bacteroidota bacterium]